MTAGRAEIFAVLFNDQFVQGARQEVKPRDDPVPERSRLTFKCSPVEDLFGEGHPSQPSGAVGVNEALEANRLSCQPDARFEPSATLEIIGSYGELL